jgi:hypothetical protein
MKKLIISLLPFLLIFLFSSSSSGQEIKVTSSFDTTRIFIGDQIKFSITVEQPSGVRLTLPFFKDTLCKNLEIISGPLTDSSLNQQGRIKITEKYIVTSFDSGKYQLPPVFVELKDDKGLKRFYSDYSILEVMRVRIAPADTTAKIYDIIKPYRAPLTLGEIFPWILLVAVLVVIGWIAMRFIRKLRKSKTGIEPVIKIDPAHIIAFRELEKLKSEQLWQKGEIKVYYSILTEILRQYLENRFHVFSLELTTVETLDALVKTGFKKDGSYNQLKTVLTGADLVKFAKYIPDPVENETNFQNSWDFVFATKEAEVAGLYSDGKEIVREESL